MKIWIRSWLIVIALSASCLGSLNEPSRVVFIAEGDSFPIATSDRLAAIVVSPHEPKAVQRVADDLVRDIAAVTGRSPARHTEVSTSREVILIGTVDTEGPIQALVEAGRIDLASIRGAWESWVTQVVETPWPGVERALVIVGSDRRGAIYGTYQLSEEMGVSPWYWWADLVPEPRAELHFKSGRYVEGPPSVKYRGIFINDEAPALTGWVRKTYGLAPESDSPPVPAQIANMGREFYGRVFEALLRLRGNLVWPAMWNNAFNEDDPANAQWADDFGVVMGTSHQEPMMRAQKEWDRRFYAKLGHWDYRKHAPILEDFWREGVRRNRFFENIYTLGLRGANDTEMAPGGAEANQALLEKIVQRQREMLRTEVNNDVTQIPQVWCLYKEVTEFYDRGMRVPDDVTLLWTDDNWGNLRRLPLASERSRRGSAGVYYHFDYVGGPRSYKWVDTNQIPKIWEQMNLAASHEANRIWITNVGDFRGMERPTEFFLNMAWRSDRWNAETADDFIEAWARREFGADLASSVAEVVEGYSRLNGRIKPELLSPTLYSHLHHREWETVINQYERLVDLSTRVQTKLRPELRDAYFHLVHYPLLATALVSDIHRSAGLNHLYVKQGRASAREMAERAERRFKEEQALVVYYNTHYAKGRWRHFMDQTKIGFTSWRDPAKDTLEPFKLSKPVPRPEGGLGLAIEGREEPVSATGPLAHLPPLHSFDRSPRAIEVYNRGLAPLSFTVLPSDSWIHVTKTKGELGEDQRIEVSIDWTQLSVGDHEGSILVESEGERLKVGVKAHRAHPIPRTFVGFAESAGVLSMEAQNFSRARETAPFRWEMIEDYGRTLSGMRAWVPPFSRLESLQADSPRLEYDVWIQAVGEVDATVILGPSLNIHPEEGLAFAVSVNDEPPSIVEVIPKNFVSDHSNRKWEAVVARNAHRISFKLRFEREGPNTIKYWPVSPYLVLEKLYFTRGSTLNSFLGPPESLRAPSQKD